MVGARGHTVKAFALLAVFLAAGCGHSDARLAITHVDLLTEMAEKGTDLVANGRFTAESMPELTYPLERAQAFAQSWDAGAPSPPPASHVAFATLVARYREFVDTLDRVRRTKTGAAAREALSGPLRAVQDAAAQVRAALHAEGRA
jgi:hypothetical protein